MDLWVGATVIGFVAVSAGILLLISKYGMKEKTYEEALAEQRRMPDSALLIKPKPKPKSKPKDSKKSGGAGKKPKKKQPEPEETATAESDEPDEIEVQPQVHVKILPEPEILDDKRPPEPKKKKSKVKPILVVKREEVGGVDAPPPTLAVVNHFDRTQPKDDASLKKTTKQEPVAVPRVVAAEPQTAAGDAPQPAAAPLPVVPVIEELIGSASASSSGTPVDSSRSSPVPSKAKDKKKKKTNDSSNPSAVTVQELSSMIIRAELSPYERQQLTDLLLTDQSDAREWSEDAQMAKLKKQLAEKEEQLTNEAASALGVQTKLKELRVELNEEKSKTRALEEAMMLREQGLQSRMHQMTRERQVLMQDLQQAQGKIKDDALIIRSLQEASQQKVALQQEIHTHRQQISQMEMHIQRLTEAENGLKGQLHGATASCNAEIQNSHRLEADLRNALDELESIKASMQQQQDLHQQIQETNITKRQLESVVDQLKTENQRLSAEAKDASNRLGEVSARLHESTASATDSNSQLNASKTKLNEVTAKLAQTQADYDTKLKLLTREVLDLKQEKEKLSEEARHNGADLNTQFINQENENKKKEVLVRGLEQELSAKDTTISNLQAELKTATTVTSQVQARLQDTQQQLDAQVAKNNDLRQKNWKTVDALKNAEQALENKTRETDRVVDKTLDESRVVLEKSLPGLVLPSPLGTPSTWLPAVQAAVGQLQAQQQNGDSEQVAELRGVVDNYKTIIDDTEAMLTKLQAHIEAEESRWRDGVEIKQKEIDLLAAQLEEKERLVGTVQKQVADLTERVATESDSISKVCNERDEAKKQLSAEQDKLKELHKEMVKLRSNLKIGQDSYEAEHKIRLELEDKMKALVSSESTGTATPVQLLTNNESTNNKRKIK